MFEDRPTEFDRNGGRGGRVWIGEGKSMPRSEPEKNKFFNSFQVTIFQHSLELKCLKNAEIITIQTNNINGSFVEGNSTSH